ncbi:unnamed protein product, partial [Ectocarpus sp. 12 AP-2014]
MQDQCKEGGRGRIWVDGENLLWLGEGRVAPCKKRSRVVARNEVPILRLDRDVRKKRVQCRQNALTNGGSVHSCWFVLGNGPAVVVTHDWGVVFSVVIPILLLERDT